MLDTLALPGINATPSMTDGGGIAVLKMKKNERMGGSAPVWESPAAGSEMVATNLSRAAGGVSSTRDATAGALAYAPDKSAAAQGQEQPFGFKDILDMVNPLQHIPLVSTLYRNLTGDEPRGISKIIGGAIYGGPLGAAAGLINVAVENETGKDLAGNVMAFVSSGKAPHYRSMPDTPQTRLSAAANGQAPSSVQNLPGTVLSFANLRSDESFTSTEPKPAFKSFVLNT
jgi:hypothetical protein